MEKEVLSVPAGPSYHLIEKYGVHAHPIKGYSYQEKKYISFRKKGGVMEYLLEFKYILLLELKPKLENWEKDVPANLAEYLPALTGYINERKKIKLAFICRRDNRDDNVFKFYILTKNKRIELEKKPAIPKLQSHTYLTLKELSANVHVSLTS